MDKEYFKILIEKYLDGNASTAEVKELCEWIKNNDSLDRWIMQAIERSDFSSSMRKSMNVCIPALKRT